jgi:hypothetical protein
MPELLATSNGFELIGDASRVIWWSRTGGQWTRLDSIGATHPDRFEPQGATADGSSVLLIEQAQQTDGGSGATGIWRLELTDSKS